VNYLTFLHRLLCDAVEMSGSEVHLVKAGTAGGGCMERLLLRRNAESLFWFVMWCLLILGLASWIIEAAFSKTDAADWIGGPLGIGVWAGALALCALLLRFVSNVPDLLRAVSAMWRPLLLVLAAAYLLFSNDQGRELGLSLMGENRGWRIFFLFLALIYWAANNWHTARLGLRAAIQRFDIPVPRGNEKWLFWPPRLLGVCAHLFAAINLSLAATNQPEFADSMLWPVVWTAPLAIALATALAWLLDRLLLSRRTSLESTRSTWIGAVVVVIGLLGGITIVAFAVPSIPAGFSLGTISISASAIVFLIGVSLMRRRKPLGPNASEAERDADNRRENWEVFIFTAGLFVIAVIFACATWMNPVAVGGFFGSMVVAYFALGAILALVNAFESAVTWTTRNGWFGDGAKPRVVGAYAVAFVIGLGVLNAWLHPFHRVRPCDGGDCVVPASAAGFPVVTLPDDRPTVATAARAWYEQAKTAYEKMGGAGPVPMVVVATAGGGIRAAYWTTTVLERLEKNFEAKGGVRPYLFAISGVSGGSVGATAFDAALAQRDEGECKAGESSCPLSTTFLTADFLAPALASLVFVDTPSSFLPDFGQDDRGTVLEKTFESASRGLLKRPFLSLFPYKKDTTVKGRAPWRPILLLNATHEETGRRIITGHVLIERNVFIDSLDALHVLGKDVRASTAAHNSARFTYISPAGDLGNKRGSVIDGGYFENYGALSALELARAARLELIDEKPGIKLIILMISSDPDLNQADALVRIKEAKDGGNCLVSVAEREGTWSADVSGSQKPAESPNYLSIDKQQVQNAWLNEFLAPFHGITKVREAHGNRAAAELAVQICSEFSKPPEGSSDPMPDSKSATLSAAAQSPQTQNAAVLAKAKHESVKNSPPAKASHGSPYFAHIAMCKEGQPAPIQPPLGWVLSKATQKDFGRLLEQCGNDHELSQLEIALGGKPQQNAGQ
jgi:hypothetical protein